MFESKTSELILKASVHGKRNPEDFESVRIKVFQCVFLLFLDPFLESANRLDVGDFDRKDMTKIIAEN
jgi:hypothetical protein